MTLTSRKLLRLVAHAAVIGTLATAFTLGGCGRKGPLDLPPSASTQQQPAEGQSGTGDTSAQRSDSVIVRSAAPTEYGSDGKVLAPRGQKKKLPGDIFID